MAELKPFAALRPRPDLAARICELPYDVFSAEEARRVAAGLPLSFLHVSRPEVDLLPGTDPCAPAVYAQGRENLARLRRDGALRQDEQACYYLYRLAMGARAQTGFVGVASCEEYGRGVIRKHELTRPDKEDDRVRHIEALDAQTGPALLVYRAARELDQFAVQHTRATPAIEFTAPDGVRHSAWVIADREGQAFVASAFQQVGHLYIADGHHRTAAAARVSQARGGRGGSGQFLAVAFPHDQLQILPYHRVLKDLNAHTPATLLNRLAEVFETLRVGSPQPERRHEVGFYLDRQWRRLRFRVPSSPAGDRVEALDVTLLQKRVLEPVFGIDNPRASERISFVGGIRGTGELERSVDSGEYACVFALYPTSIHDLMTIADAGGLMPPKSTWFEPKLRDGMFCHLLASANP